MFPMLVLFGSRELDIIVHYEEENIVALEELVIEVLSNNNTSDMSMVIESIMVARVL